MAAAEAAAIGAYEADVRLVRELRMGLREITTRLLTDRRWRAFAEPVTPDDDPEYWHRVRYLQPSASYPSACYSSLITHNTPHHNPLKTQGLGLQGMHMSCHLSTASSFVAEALVTSKASALAALLLGSN